MLTNVHPDVTVADIREKFYRDGIENVTMTFRVKDYHNCLLEVYHIQKERIIALKKGKSK
jgi:hypothetical protein